MRCPHCDNRMVEMSANGPSRFTLLACGSCDQRQWMIDGRPASLTDVIDRVSRWGRDRRPGREAGVAA